MADSLTDRIAEAFRDCTLPKAEWTHEAHLRVGVWHLLRYSPVEALDRLRDGIRRYNVASGGTNTETSGYHESITRFYVWLIARFLATANQRLSVDELVVELVQQFGDKELPLRYWSRDRLFSVEARSGWVEPDIQPLA